MVFFPSICSHEAAEFIQLDIAVFRFLNNTCAILLNTPLLCILFLFCHLCSYYIQIMYSDVGYNLNNCLFFAILPPVIFASSKTSAAFSQDGRCKNYFILFLIFFFFFPRMKRIKVTASNAKNTSPPMFPKLKPNIADKLNASAKVSPLNGMTAQTARRILPVLSGNQTDE